LIRLERRPLLGFISDPFGKSAREMTLVGDDLRIKKRNKAETLSLGGLREAPVLQAGYSEQK
jgi:hypothetical protein